MYKSIHSEDRNYVFSEEQISDKFQFKVKEVGWYLPSLNRWKIWCSESIGGGSGTALCQLSPYPFKQDAPDLCEPPTSTRQWEHFIRCGLAVEITFTCQEAGTAETPVNTVRQQTKHSVCLSVCVSVCTRWIVKNTAPSSRELKSPEDTLDA